MPSCFKRELADISSRLVYVRLRRRGPFGGLISLLPSHYFWMSKPAVYFILCVWTEQMLTVLLVEEAGDLALTSCLKACASSSSCMIVQYDPGEVAGKSQCRMWGINDLQISQWSCQTVQCTSCNLVFTIGRISSYQRLAIAHSL